MAKVQVEPLSYLSLLNESQTATFSHYFKFYLEKSSYLLHLAPKYDLNILTFDPNPFTMTLESLTQNPPLSTLDALDYYYLAGESSLCILH